MNQQAQKTQSLSSAPQSAAAWLFLLWVSLFASGTEIGCAGPEAGSKTLVRVKLENLAASTERIRVKIEANAQTRERDFDSAPFSEFGITLPADMVGEVKFAITALDQNACQLSVGDGHITILQNDVYELRVPMADVPLCGQQSAKVTIQLTSSAGELGEVSAPGFVCQDAVCRGWIRAGQPFMLTAKPRPGGAFCGWVPAQLCDESSGREECRFTLDKTDPLIIAATFGPCTGWRPVGSRALSKLQFNAVHAASDQAVVAVGDGGAVAAFDGTKWSVIKGIPTPENLRAVTSQPGGAAFVAVGDNGTVIGCDGIGMPWHSIQNRTGSGNLYSVAMSNNGEILVGGQRGILLTGNKSRLVMQNGVNTGDSTVHTVRYPESDQSGNRYLVAMENGNVIHMTFDQKNGTWDSHETQSNVATTSAWYGDSRWALVGDKGFLASKYFIWFIANDWQNESLSASVPARLSHVWGRGSSCLVAVGERGTIQRSYEPKTWFSARSGVTEDLTGVSGTACNKLYAVGKNGTILHYSE